MLTNILTPKIRKVAYAVYASVGFVLGAAQIWVSSTAGTSQPGWLTSAAAVFLFAGTAFGFTASANASVTPTDDTREDDGDL